MAQREETLRASSNFQLLRFFEIDIWKFETESTKLLRKGVFLKIIYDLVILYL